MIAEKYSLISAEKTGSKFVKSFLGIAINIKSTFIKTIGKNTASKNLPITSIPPFARKTASIIIGITINSIGVL